MFNRLLGLMVFVMCVGVTTVFSARGAEPTSAVKDLEESMHDLSISEGVRAKDVMMPIDQFGTTKLHKLARAGAWISLMGLVSIDGVNPNVENELGQTPWSEAEDAGKTQCLKVLQAVGVNTHIRLDSCGEEC